ncbi:pyruvate kinase [Cupriavidus taiwanensis]|uniref:pyruvate kinase n=1 Tax=Cupriavidus taiwanensis TaxID=164546 RepID=UPI000E102D78|nr:pyruvate kinase [Cupriavidus taiwanensis]SOY52674.1 PYRUVATE KINASE; tartrate degradation [Cupriavidus taiwanensis]SOY52835.1 PYRUVATE KINASE; tartrate degradation [Cupriavidus taiwanensis]SOY85730.1 PYRUVATE KINASE; tartrate degradation [Cupriavidus taiwanensis]SOZ60332.1 PYRUVATE KINASE; tartrate degradation [Cupriavidus taiwanensis]SOZ80561.1 PYRUVATE KINASE; tartrate degradation [Cupriavidus taiwanensis]
MRRQRKAKIVATLGPASTDIAVIRALFEAGADVFRLNFSHGTHDDHRARYDAVRQVEVESGRPIAVLADLQGPKLRIGTFAAGKVAVRTGDVFVLDSDPTPGDGTRVYLPHPELFQAAQPGQSLLIDDGKVRLAIESVTTGTITTRVANNGTLSDRKGVNVPDAVIPIPALTEKDRKDLDFALSLGADWIGLSFVQRPSDIVEAREIVGTRAGILSKIEKPAALQQLEEIVRVSDSVMVARGDLGVELPPERVPGVQKRILRVCRQLGKPVVIATQMLESMIDSPVPTRAEASDVASAIYEGADAVMLSAESANGRYPVPAVSMMNRIVTEVERDPLYRNLLDAQHETPLNTRQDAICAALREVTHIIGAAATVTYTSSGSTALRAARERPCAPIVSITPNLEIARRLAIAWGIHSTVSPDVQSVDEMVEAATRAAVAEGYAAPGDQITIAAGMPFGQGGTTNLLRVAEVSASAVAAAPAAREAALA